jgi:hypothetical protein
MRVIFLDMDGVLNSHEYLYVRNKKAIAEAEGDEEKGFLTLGEKAAGRAWNEMVDPVAVKRLNRIIHKTGAKCVLSSSWRYQFQDVSELQTILVERGFEGELIDRTKLGREMEAGYHENGGIRGIECSEWLSRHPSVTAYVILDDADDFTGIEDRLVRTRWAEGLLDPHVELAIKILDRER